MITLLPQYEGAVVTPPPTDKNGRVRKSVYTVNGKEYDRVTNILNVVGKPALVPWAIRETTNKMRAVMESSMGTTIDPVWVNEALQAAKDYPDEARDAAAERGNEIHAAIHDYVVHGVDADHPDFDEGITTCIHAYQAWANTTAMEAAANEFTVWSDRDGYAGTIDEVCIKPNGHWSIVDFKTGRAYLEHTLQVAAYAQGLEEMTGIPVDDAWLLRIPRDQPDDGSPQFFTKYMSTDNIQNALEAFRNALSLQRALKGPEGRLWM
jgi:hypothetical protein